MATVGGQPGLIGPSPLSLGFADYQLAAGQHICAIYENHVEQAAVSVPYVKTGLALRQRVIYLGDERAADELQRLLALEQVPVQQHITQGDLLFLCRDAPYRRHGRLQPGLLLEVGKELVRSSLAEGWPLVRLLGEHTWLLRTPQDITRWLAYESRLDYELPGMPAIIVCHYDRTRLPAEFIDRIIATHPVAVLRGILHANPFYHPPQQFLTSLRRPH